MVARRTIVLALLALALCAATLDAQWCVDCAWSRFWTIDRRAWRASTAPVFPESPMLEQERPTSLGVAFSGGGTRSATASVGQLRGLAHNGWLDKVRYVTGVSGGSWAAVPFTFSRLPLDELVGPMEEPRTMTLEAIKRAPAGSLPRSIVASRLDAAGLAEGLELVARQKAGGRGALGIDADTVLDHVFGIRGSADQTYADMLGRFFVAPHVPDGTTKPYAWNDASVAELITANPTYAASDFITATPNRPFLIVGGSMIYMHPAYDYPRLIPVEYTPLYSGVRQQFGGRLGGTYVWPFAYDVEAADRVDGDKVRVIRRPRGRQFTLADVIASSGAAPLLGLFRGKPVSALRFGAQFFPMWNHYTVRQDETTQRATATPAMLGLSHGDGGFTDNLGVMPLLARGVQNIMLFVNSKDPFEESLDLQTLFRRLDRREDWSGDRSGNVVFDSERWTELRDGLSQEVAAKRPAIYCGRGWTVLGNELYNIHPYSGLNICFVYNHAVESWVVQLPEETQRTVRTRKEFRHFPWFSTFEENAPHLIQLHAAQVNLFANLTAWSITNTESRCRIADGLREVLGGCPGGS